MAGKMAIHCYEQSSHKTPVIEHDYPYIWDNDIKQWRLRQARIIKQGNQMKMHKIATINIEHPRKSTITGLHSSRKTIDEHLMSHIKAMTDGYRSWKVIKEK